MIEFKRYLNDILGKDLEYFDYKENRSLWETYYADAQHISKNETFLNELNRYRRVLMEEATFRVENFEQLMHVRTAIITLETFLQRLQQVEDPNQPGQSKEEINKAI